MYPETKLADDAFRHSRSKRWGTRVCPLGQGQWNGVAIMSKVGIDDVVVNFADGIEPEIF